MFGSPVNLGKKKKIKETFSKKHLLNNLFIPFNFCCNVAKGSSKGKHVRICCASIANVMLRLLCYDLRIYISNYLIMSYYIKM
jgi:hypothetical protein